MTTPFVIDLDGLTDLIDDIAAFDRTVAGQANALDDEVSSLHASWTGEAAQAQGQAHARLLHGIAAMRQGLADMRRAGAIAHANYSAAAQANDTMFDGLA